ncbi:MAG: RNA methyltransferase [Cyanobacteria bacterium J06600_6]
MQYETFNPDLLNLKATLAVVKRIKNDRAYRDRYNLFFIEGVRNFVRLADNKFKFAVILYSEKLLIAPLARKLVRQLRRSGITTIKLTPEQYRHISSYPRASGVAAVAYQHWSELNNISPCHNHCWVVLEKVNSPGNLGALIRTSEAVSGGGFILLGKSIDPFDPNVIRATMGALFEQNIIRTKHGTFKRWLGRRQYSLIGVSPDGKENFHQFKFPDQTLLFLGEEKKGLTSQQRELCQDLVSIPMTGKADSLNVAIAGSLLLYEVHRQNYG